MEKIIIEMTPLSKEKAIKIIVAASTRLIRGGTTFIAEQEHVKLQLEGRIHALVGVVGNATRAGTGRIRTRAAEFPALDRVRTRASQKPDQQS